MRFNLAFLSKIFILVTISLATSHASHYDEYFKELNELKINSEQNIIPQIKHHPKFKDAYNELSRNVNKYIDYFALIVDEKKPFDAEDIEKKISSINIRLKKLRSDLENEVLLKSYTTPLSIPVVPILIGIIYFTIENAEPLYNFYKRLISDLEKSQFKKQLQSYKWQTIK